MTSCIVYWNLWNSSGLEWSISQKNLTWLLVMISWYAQLSLVTLNWWKGVEKNSYLRALPDDFSRRTSMSSSSIFSVISNIFYLVADTFLGTSFSSSSDRPILTTLRRAELIYNAWCGVSIKRAFYGVMKSIGSTDWDRLTPFVYIIST